MVLTIVAMLLASLFSMFVADWIDHAFRHPLIARGGIELILDVARRGWLMSLTISAALPLWACYTLFKSIVKFFVVGQNFGSRFYPVFSPRFSIAAVGYPKDEVGHRKVWENLYAWGGLLTDFDKLSSRNAQEIYQRTAGAVVPKDRAKFELPTDLGFSTDSVRRSFNVNVGLAGLADHTLSEEASLMEALLARCVLQLKSLALISAASFFLVAVTGVVYVGLNTIRSADFLTRSQADLMAFDSYIYSIGSLVWGAASIFLIRQPIRWTFELSDPYWRISRFVNDAHFVRFERVARVLVLIACQVAALSLTAQVCFSSWAAF